MTVHVGEITSEVTAMGDAAGPDTAEMSMWEQQCRTESTLERLARDRLRTTTGHGHD